MPIYDGWPEQEQVGPLQVPYYSQSGLAWCTPTALLMLFGYHGNPYGDTGNWSLAGLVGQDRDKARPNYWVIEKLNMQQSNYEFLWWDAQLVQ